MSIPLQVAPDAEVKSQNITLEIVYEGTRNKQEFTEKSVISVPVFQKARVRTDQPQIYDEAWVGQTVSMSVQMFNMGKSTLYNCMVEVQGEGLSLEESFYGGNVAPGSTMRADLTLKTAVAGDIDGQARIIYEDVFGTQSEELLPFHVTVNEQVAAPDPAELETMAEPAAQGPSGMQITDYWWVAALLLGIVLTLILLVLVKRKRARLLEDEAYSEGEE